MIYNEDEFRVRNVSLNVQERVVCTQEYVSSGTNWDLWHRSFLLLPHDEVFLVVTVLVTQVIQQSNVYMNVLCECM